VVRHRLVGEIVDAYGRWDAEQHAITAERTGGPRQPQDRMAPQNRMERRSHRTGR